MYEFPMLKDDMTQKEVLAFCEKTGLSPLHIKKLPDAKHVFSHVEWHMKGYVVRVDELAERSDSAFNDWIFIEPEETKERYPIPTAFAAYTKGLDIQLGYRRYREEKE